MTVELLKDAVPQGFADAHIQAMPQAELPVTSLAFPEIVRIWTQIRDLESLYSAMADTVEERFSIVKIAIFLYRPRRRTLQPVFERGLDSAKMVFRDTADHPLLKRLLSNEPTHITDLLKPSPSVSDPSGSLGEGSYADIGFPLVLGEKAVGMLAVGRKTDGNRLDPIETDVLMQLAAQASICIENCRLYGKGEEERETLNVTLTNLALLYDIGQAMTYISDLKSLLEYILNQAIKISNAEKGSIMLYDERTDELSIRILTGMVDETHQEKINSNEVTCKTFKPGEGVAGQVYQTGSSIILNKVRDALEFIDPQSSFVNSIACIPLTVYGENLGVINVTNKQDNTGFNEQDISMLKAVADQAAIAINKAQLWDMAFTDSLTGLYDRRYFKLKLQEESQRAKRYHRPFSIVMADLDNFKAINDTYGHGEGDRALKAIGRTLKKQIRNVDVIARYGGDEFIMLFPEKEKGAARRLSERLREQVAADHFVDGATISVSIGIASYPEDGEDIDVLMDKADRAMYHAKQMGRNRIEWYSDTLSNLAHRSGDQSNRG